MSFILQQLTGLSFLNIYAARTFLCFQPPLLSADGIKVFFRQAGFAKPFDITAILSEPEASSIPRCIPLTRMSTASRNQDLRYPDLYSARR